MDSSEDIDIQIKKLELLIKEREVKWSSGWRRLVDRFLTPTMLGVLVASFGAIITFQNWKDQIKQELIIKSQEQLLLPPLAASAVETLVREGDEGIRALWLFLNSTDSSSVGAQMQVLDILIDYSRTTGDTTLFSKFIGNLLSSSGGRRGKTDPASLYIQKHLFKKIWELCTSPSKFEPIASRYFRQFQDIEKKLYTSLLEKKKDPIYISPGIYLIPSSHFLDSTNTAKFLGDYWVRFNKISKNDSSLIHSYLDSQNLNQLALNSQWIINKTNIGKWIGAGGPTDRGNYFDLTIGFWPNVEFYYTLSKTPISKEDRDLMRFKFEWGVLGKTYDVHGRFPFIPRQAIGMRYIRDKKHGSRLELPKFE